SKFKAVFGAASDQVDQFIGTFGRLAGLTVTEGREITSTLGGMAKGFGMNQDAAGEFSQEVVRLAGDMASFNNADISETLRAIQSGLIGEQEPLRRYGVLLSQTRVEQAASEIAGRALNRELTEQEKVMARLRVVIQDLTSSGALGDLERTQDSTRNSFVQTRRDMRQYVEDFSRGLIPAYGEAIAFGRRLLDLFGEQAQSLGGTLAGAVVKAVQYMVDFTTNTGRACHAVFLLIQSLGLLGGGTGGILDIIGRRLQ